TGRPRNDRQTNATAGPLLMSVQIAPRGTGANGARNTASVRQAFARIGSVPLSGLQRSVHVADAFPLPSGQTVMRRLVDDCAAAELVSPMPIATATTAIRRLTSACGGRRADERRPAVPHA